MNKTDSDKLAAIHRSAEINKLEIENMIDIFEKKMSIVENKLIEYECRYELTERQEDMMYKLQEQLNEMQDSIDSIEVSTQCTEIDFVLVVCYDLFQIFAA